MTVALHAAHDPAVQEVDDGNQFHGAGVRGSDGDGTTRILVYEHLSAGGAGPAGDAAVAALLPMGLAMREAIAADLLRVGDALRVTVATMPGTGPMPPGLVATTLRAGESALDFVEREARRHDFVWVVAPETDGLLAAFARRVAGDRWLGCRADAIELASSKRGTARHLDAAGIPTALAFADDASTRRWVVKPDDGAGSVETRVHPSRAAALADAEGRRQRGARAVVEPWVDGRALSLSLLGRGDGTAELLSINAQQIEVEADGGVRYRGVETGVVATGSTEGAALGVLARRIARSLPGLAGFVGVDVVWHPRRGPVAIEVNPRATCAYAGLSRALGRNLAAEVLARRRADGRRVGGRPQRDG